MYRICLYILNCRILTFKIMTVCEDFNVVCVLLCKLYQKTLKFSNFDACWAVYQDHSKRKKNVSAYRLQAGFFFIKLLFSCVVSNRNPPCLFDWIIVLMMIVNMKICTLMTFRLKQTEICSFLFNLNYLIQPR